MEKHIHRMTVDGKKEEVGGRNQKKNGAGGKVCGSVGDQMSRKTMAV